MGSLRRAVAVGVPFLQRPVFHGKVTACMEFVPPELHPLSLAQLGPGQAEGTFKKQSPATFQPVKVPSWRRRMPSDGLRHRLHPNSSHSMH